MASGPLLGAGGGGGNDGSRERHRWAESKVYTRKSFNKSSGSKLNNNPNNTQPPKPPSSPPQTLAAAATTTTAAAAVAEDVNSSVHQPPPPPPLTAAASSDDSSSLHRRPKPHANGRLVTISLASCSKSEARELRHKLVAELDEVRALVQKFEAREHQMVTPTAAPIPTPTAAATKVAAKRAPTNSEAASAAPLRRQLSVSVPDNSVGEKEKRTPKANQYYRNSDFILGKEKFPQQDSQSHKKSKSTGSKTMMLDAKLYSQAFKSCALLLSKLMKHKHGWVFNTPVDVKALGLHDYYTIIKHPMDLGTVKSRLSKNWYKTPKEFAEDVRLTFRNAMTYNPKGQDVHFMAEQLLQMFEEQWPAIEAECNYLLATTPPAIKRLPTLDTRRILERSDSTVHPHLMAVESKAKPPVSYATPHIGRPPALKKPKAKDLHKRDMTFEEKQRLSNNLQNLPPEKLDNIVQIIKKRNSALSQHDDEIEVDIDSVDTETLWELDRFVTNYKKSLSKNKRKAELAVLARAEAQNQAEQGRGQERVPDSVVGVPRESKTVDSEKVADSSLPVGGEKKVHNVSRSSSSSSSSSDSGSSSSDSESESSSADGSDGANSPRP